MAVLFSEIKVHKFFMKKENIADKAVYIDGKNFCFCVAGFEKVVYAVYH